MSKYITEQTQYEREQENNERIFKEALKKFRPDLFVIMDILDQTNINWFIVVKIMRQLNNVAMGTGYGQVKVDVQNGNVIFIKGEDSDRINEPLIKKVKK